MRHLNAHISKTEPEGLNWPVEQLNPTPDDLKGKVNKPQPVHVTEY